MDSLKQLILNLSIFYISIKRACVPVNVISDFHQGSAAAHLLPGHKGGQDVHLLLLTAIHLNGDGDGDTSGWSTLKDAPTLIGPMKMLLWAVMMVPVPAQPRLSISSTISLNFKSKDRCLHTLP